MIKVPIKSEFKKNFEGPTNLLRLQERLEGQRESQD